MEVTSFSLSCILCFAILRFINTIAPPIVRISFGDLIGFRDGSVSVFLGIPYAAPPVETLRFMPPKPPTGWNVALKALEYSKRCMQDPAQSNPPLPREDMSEDCLYLNLFSPNISGKLPVMVFIHGGGFVYGSAADFPVAGIVKNLADRGVVVVTINYRLNAFGYFSTKTADVPGNLGMLDQIAALKWVQQEIAHFGGDRGQVTIFGESAGGSSVSLLTYSPMAKGLFHRAIMQSGTAYSTWALNGRRWYVEGSKQIAMELGCTTEMQWKERNFTELLSCLQKVELNALLAAVLEVQNDDTFQLPWGPVVDGSFLPDLPENLIDQRASIPLMIGSTRDEWAYLYVGLLAEGKLDISSIDRKWFDEHTLLIANSKAFGSCALNVTQMINEFYGDINQTNANVSRLTWFDRVIESESDYAVAYSVVKEARLMMKAISNSPVYLYSLDFISPNLPWARYYPAVAHLADLYYLFDDPSGAEFLFFPQVEKTPADKYLVELFGIAWTNFAKFGNPNPLPKFKEWTENSTVLWNPMIEEKAARYLSIKSKPEMQPFFRPKAETVWGINIQKYCPSVKNA